MVSKSKIGTYAIIGGLCLIGGYFIYTQIRSGEAGKAAKGYLSGAGSQALKLIGLTPDQVPLLSKQESKNAIAKMQSATSPIPGHSPITQTPPSGLGGTGKREETFLNIKPKMSAPAPKTYQPAKVGRSIAGVGPKIQTLAKPIAKTRALSGKALSAVRARYGAPRRGVGARVQPVSTIRRGRSALR